MCPCSEPLVLVELKSSITGQHRSSEPTVFFSVVSQFFDLVQTSTPHSLAHRSK